MNEADVVSYLIDCFDSEHKVLICGNGGSSAEASHLAGEFLCKVSKTRPALPAIALNDPQVMSAIGNDFGFENIFARQVGALGNKGDILITLSTSGKSPNILKAIKMAEAKGMRVISFPTNEETNSNTQRTQEIHLRLIHDITQAVEDYYYEEF